MSVYGMNIFEVKMTKIKNTLCPVNGMCCLIFFWICFLILSAKYLLCGNCIYLNEQQIYLFEGKLTYLLLQFWAHVQLPEHHGALSRILLGALFADSIIL